MLGFWKSDVVLESPAKGAPVIEIDFCDFWEGFNKTRNYLTELLLRRYSLKITPRPRFLIYSNFGQTHRQYDCTKIFYTGENVRPSFAECDYAFTFDFIENEPRHYRLPLYAWWDDAERLIKPESRDHAAVASSKVKFCNFIYGNVGAKRRLEFLEKLSRYKPVDCAGVLMNNTGRVVTLFEKVDFIRDYKFTIAFENTEQPGYTTEKLVHPMLAESLAIYWGNPVVHRDFNTRSFVNLYDFNSDDAAIERIVEIDRSVPLHIRYLSEPYYVGNRVNEFVDPTNILDQFARIFAHGRN